MTIPTENEQPAQNSAPEPLAGYVRAFDGTQVKRCCENCQQIYNDSDSYQPAWLRCSEYPFMENLSSFPFKNGCKHFELHWTYAEDYDEQAQAFTEECAAGM